MIEVNLYKYDISVPLSREVLSLVKTVPDFPRPGILYRDIMPILSNPLAFYQVCEWYARAIGDAKTIVALESRGFIFGAAVAAMTGSRFIPIRKAGKLPGECLSESYALEYGEDSIEIQAGVIAPQEEVVVIDDVLATGGTASAAARLIEKAQGTLVGCYFLLELMNLKGRESLSVPVVSAFKI
jgi:adenine phosphoribosyltransferase